MGVTGGGGHRDWKCPSQAPHEEVTYAHAPGVALLHRGKHRHGAHRLTGGERHNLILWCRADPARGSEGLAGAAPHRCREWCWARAGLLSAGECRE